LRQDDTWQSNQREVGKDIDHSDEYPESNYVNAFASNEQPGLWQMTLEANHKETGNHPQTYKPAKG